MEPSRSTKRASHAPRPACLAGRSRLRSGQISTPRESARSAMRAPMKARVHVTLKNGVLDPQGKAIEHALAALGFAGVDDVRPGKVIEFPLAEREPAKARARSGEHTSELQSLMLTSTTVFSLETKRR